MDVFYKALYYSAMLLLVSGPGSDLQTLTNSKDSKYAMTDCADAQAEEEDSAESEDADATGDFTDVNCSRLLKDNSKNYHSLNFSNFIEEIAPPPPQA